MAEKLECQKENTGKNKAGRKRVDLTGKRFGRLVAVYPTQNRDGKGSVYWHCRCDCGNEVEVPEDSLIFKNNVSCGCMRREWEKKLPYTLHHVDGTCIEWLANRKSRSDNKSGFRGVFRKKNGRFRVTIGFKREKFYLGSYETMEEAVEIRKKAEKEIHEAFLDKYKKWQKKAEADPEWGKENPLQFRVEKGVNGTYKVISGPDLP